jgi:DNA-binding CsgD family transcriptional regulator
VIAPAAQLSRRQREVLELLAEGVRAREIGDRLGLSEATVRNHIRGLLRKLGCHSQLQALARARELHLV